MEYTVNRVERPPGMTTDCLLVEGTIQLAGYDADLNIVFPGGQKAVLQWRVEGPTLDICFDQPVDVFNDGSDMKPASAKDGRAELHLDVVQLVIPLRPEYGETPECPHVKQDLSPKGYRPECEAYHDAGGHHVQAPRDDNQREEAKRSSSLPYAVGLANIFGQGPMRRFTTFVEASAFIDTLDDHEDGRYYLNGPATCKRCDTRLNTRGLCRDLTCPHSDRPQNATWTEE